MIVTADSTASGKLTTVSMAGVQHHSIAVLAVTVLPMLPLDSDDRDSVSRLLV